MKQIEKTQELIKRNLPELIKHLDHHTITFMSGSEKSDTIRTKENGFAHFRFAEIDKSDPQFNYVKRPYTGKVPAYGYVIGATYRADFKDEDCQFGELYCNVRKEVFEAMYHAENLNLQHDQHFFVIACDRTYLFSIHDLIETGKVYNKNNPNNQVKINTKIKKDGKEFVQIPLFIMEAYSKPTTPLEDALNIDMKLWTKAHPEIGLIGGCRVVIQSTVYLDHEEHMKRLHEGASKSCIKLNKKRAENKKAQTLKDFNSLSKEEFIAKYSKRTYYRYNKQ